MTKTLPILAIATSLFAFAACGGDKPQGNSQPAKQPAAQAPVAKPAPVAQEPAVEEPEFDMTVLTAYFGNEPSAPKAATPSTPEKVALGKALYHDTSLSKNGNLSCASCHDLSNYGQDGKATSPGSDGKNGDRNSPTTLNAFRNFAQFWDGRAASVEDQAIMPVLNPVEHGVADEKELVAKIQAKPELVAAFQKAFPGDGSVSVDNFKHAIGAFERTLKTRSPFDEFLEGNDAALSTEQKVGLQKFIEVGCTQCHSSRLFGGAMYQKLGVVRPYPTEDTGRMKVTGNESEKFMFKVPALLNCEKTAPYYHDGKIATLEEAVKNMAAIQLNKDLSKKDVDSIVAFLKALTGTVPEGVVMK
jgi:cytochrome c peroxidase